MKSQKYEISGCLTCVSLLSPGAKEKQMPPSNGFSPLHNQEPSDIPKQVLIIEDNLLNLKLIGAIIAAQGYNVLEATTGLLGLELARRHHPALIVMDIRLPDISGLEITRVLKADAYTADIAVIGTSAHAAASDAATQEAGCDAFMPKPIMISNFIQVLNSLVIRGAAARTSRGTETAVNGA
jgi:two-component system, cell cycle response regulator DivK